MTISMQDPEEMTLEQMKAWVDLVPGGLKARHQCLVGDGPDAGRVNDHNRPNRLTLSKGSCVLTRIREFSVTFLPYPGYPH